MIELPLNIRIFEMRDPHTAGYDLALPSVMISGIDLPLGFEDGKWTITQTDGDRTWSAAHEYKNAALLMLIAQRMGYEATLTPIAEDES